ncbi:hypothetical protein NHQ30_007627 [Ciborinia camelliae]|nr:hypothetical protein NHQ30_007627 [Ciborinia camelliae]
MFHAFGEEKKNLERRLQELPWWRFERRKVWRKRVEWLGRLEEPRLWLLFLMARRRRILSVACGRVLGRFREMRGEREREREREDREREERVERERVEMEMQTGEQDWISKRDSQVPTITYPPMISKASQTGEDIDHRSLNTYPQVSEGTQTQTQIGDVTSSFIERTADMGSHPGPCDDNFSLDPHETYLPLPTPSTLFPSLHRAEHRLRGYRRFLSLKSLAGFGLYKCDIEAGAHVKVVLREEEKMVLRRFYGAFRGRSGVRGGVGRCAWIPIPGVGREEWDEDVGRAWMGWVETNLNGGKEGSHGEGAGGPLEGRWSLELVYDWCPYRLSAVVITPLLLSLIVGFWYMQERGDVITAWTLALYIVTAAAAIVALLGIIGSLKDV